MVHSKLTRLENTEDALYFLANITLTLWQICSDARKNRRHLRVEEFSSSPLLTTNSLHQPLHEGPEPEHLNTSCKLELPSYLLKNSTMWPYLLTATRPRQLHTAASGS